MLKVWWPIFIFIFSFSNLQAANSLSYSGRLVQSSGAPVTGPVNLRAELVYTNATSTVLCSQNLTSVALTKGVFHLKLDLNCTPKTMTQVLSETPNGESVAIRIIDQTNSKSYPLQAIHSVPFSKVAEQLPQMGASAGQALAWDGSKWAPTSVGTGNGTVMSVNTGSGLTGGPITTSGTISVAAGGITSTELAANSVTASKINAGEITSTHISATANIPYSKLSIGVGEIPQDRINGLATSMSALIEDVIVDAVTGKAPSQNAVYDALNLKADRSNVTQNITAASVTGLTAPIAGADATNKTYVDNSTTTLDSRITNEVATLNTSLGTKYDKTGGVITGDVTLNTQLLLKGGANFVTVKANSGTANYTMTLPTSAGTNGYVLRTDGVGVLSWVDPTTIASGSGTVDSNSITDGSIVDADINASANIAQSKIAGLSTSLSGKENIITAGTTAQYYRGDKTFVDLGTDVRGTTLAGFTTGANSTILNTDSTLSAFQKVQGQINATNTAVTGKEPTITAGTTAQYYRGDKSWQTLNGTAVANTPAGNIIATNVQSALNELDTDKQANITAASNITTGSVTTSLQNGVNINPFNTAAGNTGELRFYELSANGSHYTSLKAPDALAANINYVMPSVAPTAGQVLSSSAAGVLSWISIPSAPVTTVFGRSGAVTATAGDYSATQITNTPAGSIAGTTVQAAINELDSEKQGLITAGTTAQYYRGDKTFVDFGTDVRATALTGYTVGANTALVATDTTLGAFQKVQGQINATNTAVAGKEPAITAGTTAQYIRGDKTLSTFATDVINSVLSTFTVGTGTKPAVVNTDTVAGAFGKVQKTLNDINADYVSKTLDQTINGTLAINSATGFITVPTPINPNDAANKAYVDSYGQWLENGTSIYFNTGNVGIGAINPQEALEVNGVIESGGNESADNTRINFAASDKTNRFQIETDLDGSTGNDLLIFRSTTTDNMLVLKGNGNIGVGNTNPTHKFDVNGTVQFGTNSATSSNIVFSPSTAAQGYMRMTSDATANYIQSGLDGSVGSSRDLRFTPSFTTAPWMTIQGSTGNVGVGGASPNAKFEVVGTRQATITPTNSIFKFGGGDVFLYGSAHDGTAGVPYPVMLQAMRSSDAASFPLALNPNGGNVGIGILNPAQKLSVAGTVESTTGGFKFPDGTTQTTAATANNYGVQVKLGSFSSPAATGALAVTGLGFKPTHVRLWVQSNRTGAMSGVSTSFCTGSMTENFQMTYYAYANTPAVRNLMYNDRVIACSAADATTIQIQASYVSMDPDGFTLNFSPTVAGWTIYYEATGGSTVASSGSGTANTIPMWTTTTALGNSPISVDTGNVGIGTTTPGQKLTVTGTIESTTGGVKFPDASTQATSAFGPAWSVFSNTNPSTSNTAWVKVPYNQVEFDTNSSHDAANSRIRPTKAGYYRVSLYLQLTQTGTGGLTNWMALYKNGTSYRQVSELANYTASYTQSLQISTLVYMNGTTDYLEGWWTTNSANAATLTAGTNYTYFTGEWVRP